MNQQVSTIDTDYWGHTYVHDVESTTGIALNVATTDRRPGDRARVRRLEPGLRAGSDDRHVHGLARLGADRRRSTSTSPRPSSPSEAAAAGARTVLVSIDGGATWQFAAVLTFAPGDSSAKTVLVRAIDDAAPEGTLDATLSMSAQSADPTYNHAEIRNVLAEAIDNDTRRARDHRERRQHDRARGHAAVRDRRHLHGRADDGARALHERPGHGVLRPRRPDRHEHRPALRPGHPHLHLRLDELDDPGGRAGLRSSGRPSLGRELGRPEGRTARSGTSSRASIRTTSTCSARASRSSTRAAAATRVTSSGATATAGSTSHGWHDQGWDSAARLAELVRLLGRPARLASVPAPRAARRRQHPAAGRGRGLRGGVRRLDARRARAIRPATRTRCASRPRRTATRRSGSSSRATARLSPSDACGCDSRFDAASGTVTFDSTNWYLPFTVRLTSNPAAPATDPFQPLETFPNPSADRVFETSSDPHDFNLVGGIRFGNGWFDGRGWRGGPVWIDGHGWYDGNGNWFDGTRLVRRPRRLVVRRRRLVRRPHTGSTTRTRRPVAPQPALQRRHARPLAPRRLERLGRRLELRASAARTCPHGSRSSSRPSRAQARRRSSGRSAATSWSRRRARPARR